MKCLNCGMEVPEKCKFCPKCGSKVQQNIQPAQPVPSSQFPQSLKAVWPEWEIVAQLGKGAFGVVYQVKRSDSRVESQAAVKIISIPANASEVESLQAEGLTMNDTKTYFKGIVDDFVEEIRLMETLKGIQNIVSVEDYKVVESERGFGWDIYIRMELLTPFNTYIRNRSMTEPEVIKLGLDICAALEICGRRNIIHRDIKPENIFINDFGHFKLGDFGIARKLENMTGGLSQKGTYNYMAPEVVRSNQYDARVDTYSLGLVLYRLLNNNRLPFMDSEKQLLNPNERKNAADRRIMGEQLPVPCGASPDMANVILRACAFDPDQRFASAAQMREALEQVGTGTYQTVPIHWNTAATTMPIPPQATAPAVGNFGDTKKEKKKRKKKTGRRLIAIACVTLILGGVIAGGVLVLRSPAFTVYKNLKSDKETVQVRKDGHWLELSPEESALVNYQQDVEGNFIQELLLKLMLSKQSQGLSEDFKNGSKEYDQVIGRLDVLAEMGFENAQEARAQVQALYAQETLAAYEQGQSEYNDAAAVLKELIREGFQEAQPQLDKAMELYANDTVEKYHSGELSYDGASTILKGLKMEGYPKGEELYQAITAEHNAASALEKADSYYESGDYENAISEYAKIPESNESYADVQKKLTQLYADYITSVLKTATELRDAGKHQEAIRQIKTACDVLPDEVDVTALTNAREETFTAYKTAVSNKVSELTVEGKYAEAFELIDEALAFQEDAYFRNLRASNEEAFVSVTTKAVDAYIASNDYKNAAKTAEKALEVLPGNEELQKLKKNVEEETPTDLKSLVVIDSHDYKYSGNIWTDSFGFVYDGFHQFDDCDNTSHAIFNLNEDYKQFSCSFVAGQETNSGCNFTVTIYLDGELAYTLSDFHKTTGRKDVTLDVSNVTKLYIKVTSNFNYGSEFIAMVNATVK